VRRNLLTKGAIIKTEIGRARIMSRPVRTASSTHCYSNNRYFQNFFHMHFSAFLFPVIQQSFFFQTRNCLAMRRIYYRFPQRVDLSFAMGMPFNETLNYIASLNNEESTKTTGKELVKVKTKIEIAVDRASFGDITPDVLRPGIITEAADLRASVLAIALRGGGKVPIANDIFYLRLTDQGRGRILISQRMDGAKVWMPWI
jgi:hypothetical protein